jgi:hypothetical protein
LDQELRNLRDIQKPLAELIVPKFDKVKLGFCPQDEVLQTPVTAEALKSLRSLIEQDSHTLDKASKQRLEKFANTTQISFAERALLEDDNQLLFKQNNEAKVRRSTKSTIVGKAKVMSYEDIEEARANRAAKEAASVLKKRGQKPIDSALAGAKAKKVWRSEVEIAEDEIAIEWMGNYCSVFQRDELL